MKSLQLQIEFIDKKLLKLYGFTGITDYKHLISISEPETSSIDINKLNEIIDEFRKVFHSKNFSLHKTQYKILTKSQAICLLKTCLEITSVPFDVSLKKNKKYLRLISKNNILDNYINKLKMAENQNFIQNSNIEILSQSNEIPSEPTPFSNPNYFLNNKNNQSGNESYKLNIKNKIQSSLNGTEIVGYKEHIYLSNMSKDVLNNSIKKKNKFEYYSLPNKLFENGQIKINMKDYDLADKTLKSFCIKFISKEFNSQPIISEYFIVEIVKNIVFEVKIGENYSYNWCGNFFNEVNCIIDDIILPLGNLIYDNVIVNLKNLNSLIGFMDNLYLVISGEYVEFYSEIEKHLKNSIIEQNFYCSGKGYNILRIMSGMAGNAYTDFLDLDRFNFFKDIKYLNENSNSNNSLSININIKNKNDINQESNLFLGNPIIYRDIEGFEITTFVSDFNYENLKKPFEYGYKFVCWKQFDSFENIKNYFMKNISKNIFSHNYKIELMHNISNFNLIENLYIDSMDIILEGIELNNNDNIKELKFYCYYHQTKITNIDVKFSISDNIIKINFPQIQIYRLITHFHLEFITNSQEEIIKNKLLLLTKIMLSQINFSNNK